MDLDLISIFLGVTVVFLFMAIFTLLRLMNSPFIMRFEPLVKAKMEPLKEVKNSYRLCFRNGVREFELLEIKFAAEGTQNKVFNNYLFLSVKSRGDFSVRFRDLYGQVQVRYILDDLFRHVHDFRLTEVFSPDLHVVYKDVRVLSNAPDKAVPYLNKNEVRLIMNDFKTQFNPYGSLIPIVIDAGAITIDYSLTAHYLNQLVNDPREVFKHADVLAKLADEIER